MVKGCQFFNIIRFFEEYAKFDIDFWGVTTQNLPVGGTEPGRLLL